MSEHTEQRAVHQDWDPVHRDRFSETIDGKMMELMFIMWHRGGQRLQCGPAGERLSAYPNRRGRTLDRLSGM